ncbi:MAG: class I SAM-dependent methyltransferase [Acidimicrobiales bacterium]
MDDVWGERTAATYDEDDAAMFSPDVLGPTIELLVELAAGRRVLEFAAGTGRVTLPLAATGIDVSAIELSEPMAARLRAKPGGDRVDLTIGDMATTRVPGEFGLVYLVYNTISNLLTQDAQVACFANAAAHLAPGGCFVIEVFVPELRRLPVGERLVAFDSTHGHIGVDEYDVVEQRLVSNHAFPGRPFRRSHHRYAWPAEYDLMARLAGLELRERWADWDRSPFTADSRSHVTVWAKPLEAAGG